MLGAGIVGLPLVTGAIQSAYRRVTWENLFSAVRWRSRFGRTPALNLAMVVVMLGLSLYHDIVVGPRSARRREVAASARRGPTAGSPPPPIWVMTPDLLTAAQRPGKRALMIGHLEAALTLLVVLLKMCWCAACKYGSSGGTTRT